MLTLYSRYRFLKRGRSCDWSSWTRMRVKGFLYWNWCIVTGVISQTELPFKHRKIITLWRISINGFIEPISQKFAIRSMISMKFRQSCRGTFKEHNILTPTSLYIYRTLSFFYKNKEYFNDFKNVNATRRIFDYSFPPYRLTLTERNAFYMCIKLHNCSPGYIKNVSSYNSFRKELYIILINYEPYSLYECMGIQEMNKYNSTVIVLKSSENIVKI